VKLVNNESINGSKLIGYQIAGLLHIKWGSFLVGDNGLEC
jgi:hypothetical protein